MLGVHLWSRQRDIVESVRDHRRTAVRAGVGVGKTTAAAVVVLWFLDTKLDSRVVSTAMNFPQVEAVLWAEIRRLWYAAVSREQAQGRPVFAREPLRTRLELPDGRYAIGLSPAPHRVEGFQGHHSPNILLLIDEASGVHQQIFAAGTGYMTTPGARLLMLGNPTRTNGEFYAAFTTRREAYNAIVISTLDSPALTDEGATLPPAVLARLPSVESIEDYRRMYGEGSIMWDVRVLGNFSLTTTDTVIALGDVEDAQARSLEEDRTKASVISCDVARYGTDETIICERVGQRIRIVEGYFGKPTTHTAARVAHWAAQHVVARIVVDDTGVGGGVTDQLRADGWQVTPFNAANAAFSPLEFPNRRSELWFQLAEQLPDLDLDGDEQLCADLVTPKYTYDLKMRRVVESKDAMRSRIGRSPDRGDAVMLTLVPEQAHGSIALPAATKRQDAGRLSAEDLRRMPM